MGPSLQQEKERHDITSPNAKSKRNNVVKVDQGSVLAIARVWSETQPNSRVCGINSAAGCRIQPYGELACVSIPLRAPTRRFPLSTPNMAHRAWSIQHRNLSIESGQQCKNRALRRGGLPVLKGKLCTDSTLLSWAGKYGSDALQGLCS